LVLTLLTTCVGVYMGLSNWRKVGFFVLPLFSLACGDIKLQKPVGEGINAKSQGDFCISPPENKNRLTKIMFVMDKSGSNNSTDPGASLRADGVEKFYNSYMNDEFIKWGMIRFGDVTDFMIIEPYFTREEPSVRQAITELRSSDQGGTPYSDALAKTELAIRDDIEAFPEEDAYYMIFFISDGQPEPYITVDQAKLLVKGLVDIKPGKVFLSSAYYGTNGPAAQEYLREMAIAGGGKYADLNDTGELDFEALIVRPTNEPWQIKNTNLMVYNTNATTCLNGKIGVDSDSDGMCDEDELRYGMNPQKRNSFPSIVEGGRTLDLRGYGDYFHWRRIVFGESLPVCVDATDEDFDLLTKCEEQYIINQRPSTVFPDGKPRYNGDPKNPDTDLDGFLDGVEIFMFKDKGSANDYLNVLKSYDGEGDNAGTQLRQHRNPTVWDPTASKYDIVINPKGFDEGRTCYSYSQSRLELFSTLEVKVGDTLPGLEHAATENAVFVHYIQTPQSDKDGPGVLKYSIQKLKADQRLSDSRGTSAGVDVELPFKSYIVPNN
jgi:hypothetical protein